jgi:sugar phosphate isomerase/epimerase
MATANRRRFLQTSAVAAVGVASASAVSAAQPAAAQPARDNGPDPFGGFTVGVQSYTFRRFRKLEDVLPRIQELGLHFVEFFRDHVPLDSSDADINAARALCFRHGITPIAFGVEQFTKDHQANRRKFEFARKLGVRYLSADPSPDSFDSLDRLVAEFGIGIAIHPHGPAGNKMLHRWYSAEVIMKAVDSHHRLIGTCLDTGHLIRCAQDPFNRKLDPALQVRHMAARNFGLHLKDHDNAAGRDVVFGRGVLNVGEVLRALRDVRFQGYISIEYEANPDNPSPDVRACLDVFKEAVRKLR